METKRCSKCKQIKPVSEFGFYKGKPGSHCLQCKRDYSAKYRKTPRGLYQNIKGRENFRKRKPFEVGRMEFIEWYNSQPKVCAYCGISEEHAPLMRKYFGAHGIKLSIDCKQNDKGYTLDNIILACDRCNFIKSNIFTHEEMLIIGERFIKPKWQAFPEISKTPKEPDRESLRKISETKDGLPRLGIAPQERY